MNFQDEFKKMSDSLQIHEGTAVWHVVSFLCVPALAAIKTQSILSSNDESRHESTITNYAEVGKHLLRRYATDAVVTIADGENQNFKQSS